MSSAGLLEEVPEAVPEPDRSFFGRMTFMKVVLVGLLLYVPYALKLPQGLGFRGLNVLNLLMAAAAVTLVVKGLHVDGWIPLTLRFLFFWATLLASVFVSFGYETPGAETGLTDFKSIVTYNLLFFLFYLAVDDTKTVRLMFAAILFVTFVASFQISRQALDYGLTSYKVANRAAGPFGDYHNSNRAGVYLAMFVPLFLAVALFYRRFRLLSLLAYGLGSFALFFTYSRQSYVCLILSSLILALRRNVVVLVLLVTAVVFYDSWMPAAVLERIDMTQNVDEQGQVELDESTESRPILWAGAREMIAGRPYGVGLGRFREEIGNFCIYDNKDAHNYYILLTAEAGLQGGVALILLVIGLGTLGVRLILKAETEEDQVLGWGYMVCFVGMIAGNLYGSPFSMGEVMGDFWALSGIVAKYLHIRFQAPPPPTAAEW
jgi:hypothetical protein